MKSGDTSTSSLSVLNEMFIMSIWIIKMRKNNMTNGNKYILQKHHITPTEYKNSLVVFSQLVLISVKCLVLCQLQHMIKRLQSFDATVPHLSLACSSIGKSEKSCYLLHNHYNNWIIADISTGIIIYISWYTYKENLFHVLIFRMHIYCILQDHIYVTEDY